jgi:hypothetical protein
LRFKPQQVWFERSLTDSEDVGPLITNNAANQLSAVPGSAHDFLDGHAFADEPTKNSVCLFMSQISLVLQALGGSQKLGIYGRCADYRADLPHRLAHSVEISTNQNPVQFNISKGLIQDGNGPYFR